MKNDDTNKTTNIINNQNLLTSQPVAYKHDHDPTQSQRVSSMFEETSSCTHFWASSSTHYLNYENKRVKHHKPARQTAEIQSKGGSSLFSDCISSSVGKNVHILSFCSISHIRIHPFHLLRLISQTTTVRLWSLGAMKVASTVLRISCRWYTSLAKFTLGASVFLSQNTWEVCGIQVL